MKKQIKNIVLSFSSRETLILWVVSFIVALLATWYSYAHHIILAYGDAESHINIAKRVVSGLTPGMAQLGGIWLPLPHILMLPFVMINFFWRTGLAGSIVGGASFIIASIYLYKISYLLLNNKNAARIAYLLFLTNPNILYLQSTPMSELPLIMFFVLSIYYFFQFLRRDESYVYLILSSFFGFCATLSRYDGWLLVLAEAFILVIFYLNKFARRKIIEGNIILFSTLAFFGIFLWMLWDFLILGDAFYFSSSPFSARSQQQGWLARGELPTYHNLSLSFIYYFVTTARTVGIWIFIFICIGLLFFIFDKKIKQKFYTLSILSVPFLFYWITMFLGQSVIFIPDLTPKTFQWHLFNVRYGVMMLPFASFFFSYMFVLLRNSFKIILVGFLVAQLMLFQLGVDPVLSLTDGTTGLSASKNVDAQQWLSRHYDGGLILLDDYARTLSIVKSNLPIEKVIYIGNKPYWNESLTKPEKYAKWIVLQKDDAVWKGLYENNAEKGRLFKYFQKVYTSPEILIFKRNPSIIASSK